ncbi:MAG TPA: ankyrin repeat domain-containing protein [Tepidisphaeraceae bacterium]
MAAADRRQLAVVRVLIDAKANLDLDDGFGGTALMMAVDVYTRDRQVDDVALALVAAGANVNTARRAYIDGPSGETPLHRAASWNQRRAVAALIAAGANVDARTNDGLTPLDYADMCGCRESADLLRAAGAKDTRHW